MQLDMGLCRDVLLYIEEEGGVDGIKQFPKIKNQDEKLIFYQIKKMSEAGYVNYSNPGKSTRSEYEHFTAEITFYGHEFLKQMLDDTLWNKTKDIAAKKGMSLTFETVKAIIPVAIQSLISSM